MSQGYSIVPATVIGERSDQMHSRCGDVGAAAFVLQRAAHPATLADAFHVAFWWSVGFSAVAMLLSLWLPGAQRTPEASRDNAPAQRTEPVGT